MVILVAGSTGFLGAEVALRLREHGHQVVALVRGGTANPKAHRLLDAGITLIEGDFTRPDTLLSACSGVEAVVSTVTCGAGATGDGLRRVDHDGALALIDAAERQGVRRFIYTSYSENIQEDCPLTTAKRDCEARLFSSAMETISLRPSYFMEMWLSPALGFDPQSGNARIYGSGEGKVSYISAFDVADFAVAATTKPYSQKNLVLEMGGPDAVSQLDAVLTFEQALGKEISVEHVPLEALQLQHQSQDPAQKTFAALMIRYALGDVVKEAVQNAEAHGIKLTSVSDYAAGLHARAAAAP